MAVVLEENGAVLLRVFENGPGFRSMGRDLYGPQMTRKTGHGIGLSFSHRVIENHGGTLSASVNDWGGAEFRIALPPRDRRERGMTPFSIFVVEDEESVRYGISLALEGKYRVRVFPDAESAIPAVRESAPDLVLMDIGLPGMNGIDALKVMKGIRPDLWSSSSSPPTRMSRRSYRP